MKSFLGFDASGDVELPEDPFTILIDHFLGADTGVIDHPEMSIFYAEVGGVRKGVRICPARAVCKRKHLTPDSQVLALQAHTLLLNVCEPEEREVCREEEV